MKVLEEREKTHGNWTKQATTAKDLRTVARLPGDIPPPISEALQMICVKLARISQGDACYVDHWEDIAGYATLAARFLKEKESDYARSV